jgi:hypothetical protein
VVSIANGVQELVNAPETWGYAASSLVLATFCMRQMVPLRVVAICSNFAFLTYGISLHLMPIVVLHTLLVPINVRRLSQSCKLGDQSGRSMWRSLARVIDPKVHTAQGGYRTAGSSPISLHAERSLPDPLSAQVRL